MTKTIKRPVLAGRIAGFTAEDYQAVRYETNNDVGLPVDKERLLEVVLAFQADCKKAKDEGLPAPILPEYLSYSAAWIANKILTTASFRYYSQEWKDEMMLVGSTFALTAFKNFDVTRCEVLDAKDIATGVYTGEPRKPNPFSTTWIYVLRGILNTLKALKNNAQFKDSMMSNDEAIEYAKPFLDSTVYAIKAFPPKHDTFWKLSEETKSVEEGATLVYDRDAGIGSIPEDMLARGYS